MRIGVAIPCYDKHIPALFALLDSIENQTRKPDAVVVSCSSTDTFALSNRYSFPLKIIINSNKKNTGQNRNIAAKNLDTDIITFFDADDIMYPRRLEVLEQAFQEPCDIALHNYLINEETLQPFHSFSECKIVRNKLRKSPSGCIILEIRTRISHGHVTVRKAIFDQVQFPEEHIYVLKADCVFCFRVFSLPDIQSAYLEEPLAKYIPSGSCHA
jgi:glycosyltransferase involved in cell wall biosynthesis